MREQIWIWVRARTSSNAQMNLQIEWLRCGYVNACECLHEYEEKIMMYVENIFDNILILRKHTRLLIPFSCQSRTTAPRHHMATQTLALGSSCCPLMLSLLSRLRLTTNPLAVSVQALTSPTRLSNPQAPSLGPNGTHD